MTDVISKFGCGSQNLRARNRRLLAATTTATARRRTVNLETRAIATAMAPVPRPLASRVERAASSPPSPTRLALDRVAQTLSSPPASRQSTARSPFAIAPTRAPRAPTPSPTRRRSRSTASPPSSIPRASPSPRARAPARASRLASTRSCLLYTSPSPRD